MGTAVLLLGPNGPIDELIDGRMPRGVPSLRDHAMREPLRKFHVPLWVLLAITTVLCVVLGVTSRWPIVVVIGGLFVGPCVFCTGFAKLVRENAFRGMLAGAVLIAVGVALTFILPLVVWSLINPGSTPQ